MDVCTCDNPVLKQVGKAQTCIVCGKWYDEALWNEDRAYAQATRKLQKAQKKLRRIERIEGEKGYGKQYKKNKRKRDRYKRQHKHQ